jgi:hypothetical protein
MSEDREALFQLGQQYFSGEGRPKDLTSALDCFRRSAELGYAPAQFELGMAYDGTALASRYGIPANEPVSFQWYLQAAEQGYRNAMGIVSMAYQTGIKGAPRDPDKAVAWYEKLARSGDGYAMMQLGLSAIQEEQIEKGAEWLKSAAKLGQRPALGLYMDYVEEGVLPALDPKEEVALLEAAAEQGDEDAMLALGLKYEKGEGVPVDLPKAYALLRWVANSEWQKGHRGEATEGAERMNAKLSADQLKAAEELMTVMNETMPD